MSATLADWTRWRGLVADLVVLNPVYLPLFDRLEAEVEEARARESNDPLEAARALLRAQKGRGQA
ncbi:hypothetical protein EYE35_01340 [Cereibacter sphaeroides]|nr:hypothetical protein EYE35_01340 [Cereibacter sphaeroides]RDS95618.1 hypothetical protein DWF04_06310 [Cereibacter sphaeroides f. sp. denitrificans]